MIMIIIINYSQISCICMLVSSFFIHHAKMLWYQYLQFFFLWYAQISIFVYKIPYKIITFKMYFCSVHMNLFHTRFSIIPCSKRFQILVLSEFKMYFTNDRSAWLRLAWLELRDAHSSLLFARRWQKHLCSASDLFLDSSSPGLNL